MSPGWIPGRKVDNSDAQYSGFRNNLPYLFLLIPLHPALRKILGLLIPIFNDETGKDEYMNGDSNGAFPRGFNAAADKRLRARTSFDVAFNLMFLFALHGSSAPKILLILYINFLIATKLRKSYVPVVTWTFNVAILFANELAEGYPYARIANALVPSTAEDALSGTAWGAFLDSYGGLQPRWDIHFNFTVLRLISFNFDHLWAARLSGSSSPTEVQSSAVEIRSGD